MAHLPRIPLRIALALGALAFLATACTSGAGGPTDPEPTGTLVTVNVVDTQGLSINGQGAYQTGDAAWTSVAPVETGTYEFRVPEDESRYGFAVNCPSGLQASSSKVLLYHATVEEATEILATCPVSFVGSATTVEGSFDATAVGGDSVDVFTSLETASGASATPSGTYGPLAIPANSAGTVVAVADDASGVPVGVRIARSVNLASAGTLALNFTVGDAVGSVMGPDWSSSVPAGYSPYLGTSFTTPDSQVIGLGSVNSAASEPLPTVSSAQSGDLYLSISLADDGATPMTTFSTIQFQGSLTDLDVDLPDPWTVTPSIVGGALPTFTGLAELPNEPNFRGHMLIFLWSGIPNMPPAPGLAAGGLIQSFVTTAWRGSASTFQVPNLTAVPGFEGARALSGDEGAWISGAFSSSLDMAALLTSEPIPLAFTTGLVMPMYPPRVEGAVHRMGYVQGGFTVP